MEDFAAVVQARVPVGRLAILVNPFTSPIAASEPVDYQRILVKIASNDLREAALPEGPVPAVEAERRIAWLVLNPSPEPIWLELMQSEVHGVHLCCTAGEDQLAAHIFACGDWITAYLREDHLEMIKALMPDLTVLETETHPEP